MSPPPASAMTDLTLTARLNVQGHRMRAAAAAHATRIHRAYLGEKNPFHSHAEGRDAVHML
eukprot:scaffold210173_cov36-Tisochrysis_lutea.AAC.1